MREGWADEDGFYFCPMGGQMLDCILSSLFQSQSSQSSQSIFENTKYYDLLYSNFYLKSTLINPSIQVLSTIWLIDYLG